MTLKALARSARLAPAALLFALAAGACSGDSSGPDVSVVGTWQLQTVNGQGLPYLVAQSGADKIEVTSDVLTVAEGGAFTEITTIRVTSSGTVTTQSIPDAGTYTINGTAVNFTFQSDGSNGTGTLNESTLTVATQGVSLVYKKQ
jgi:hypothetical protein